MNTEIRDQWVKDLTSGEYTQGKGNLTIIKPDGTELNCCLGVLCEQAVKAGVVSRLFIGMSSTVYYGADTYTASNGVLPEEVVNWAGLHANNPIFRIDGERQEASQVNDRDDNLSFPQIAELIIEQL